MSENNIVVAAIVPCFNEEATITTVVSDLKNAVPGMAVYVYDNNSTDRTAELARDAGAIVREETRQGKGNVVARAFADIEADIYVLIDGDDTYDVEALPEMIDTLISGSYDQVLGCRVDQPGNSAYRRGHAQGNRVFNLLVSALFRNVVTDMLSGYRVFSRRFVKSFPALSQGFEIETELTVHSVALQVPQCEIDVGFKNRPAGSDSKLHTIRDGLRILWLIARLYVHERPFSFYGTLALLTFLMSLVSGVPVVIEFTQTGLVDRFPSAILAAALATISFISLAVGAILSGVLNARREMMRLAYLQHSAPPFPNASQR